MNILKWVVYLPLAIVLSIVIGVIDLAMLAVAYLTKGVRLLSLAWSNWIFDDDTADAVKPMVWNKINMAYKYLVDEMYPTDDEDEES